MIANINQEDHPATNRQKAVINIVIFIFWPVNSSITDALTEPYVTIYAVLSQVAPGEGQIFSLHFLESIMLYVFNTSISCI